MPHAARFALPKVARRRMIFAGCAALGLFALSVLPASFAEAASPTASDYAAILAAPDRLDADHQTDQRRDPVAFLAFIGPQPGMNVLDMGAGAGYTTELLARAVAPDGKVYA